MPLFLKSKDSGGSMHLAPANQNLLQNVYDLYDDRSQAFNNLEIRSLLASDRILYVFESECAIVLPNDSTVTWTGSADATTCHILILREKETGISLIGHLDNEVNGDDLNEMVEKLNEAALIYGNLTEPCRFNMWLFGGFLDTNHYSQRLSECILFHLNQEPSINIDLQLASITKLNTKYVNGVAFPTRTGVAVNIRNGEVIPAKFPSDRGPDLALRMVSTIEERVTKVRYVYDYEKQLLKIGPFVYRHQSRHLEQLLLQSDEWILQNFSTSPHCEPADFVTNMRKAFAIPLQYPSAEQLFAGKARQFKMDITDGLWKRTFD